jgi:hypothetical protein
MNNKYDKIHIIKFTCPTNIGINFIESFFFFKFVILIVSDLNSKLLKDYSLYACNHKLVNALNNGRIKCASN